ncbi:60S ribosomal protein L26-like protein [Cricetulus griseus]|nr:60S ribosomal protein L26-like protein [Cricetulus griseus]
MSASRKGNATVHVGIHPIKMFITRLKLDKVRKNILQRKAKSRQVGKEKGKYKEVTIEKMQETGFFSQFDQEVEMIELIAESVSEAALAATLGLLHQLTMSSLQKKMQSSGSQPS